VSAAPLTPASGLAWYANQDGVWPEAPRDAFAGAGAGHQLLLAVPSLGLVAVRLGRSLAEPGAAGRDGEARATRGSDGFWPAAHRHLIAPLLSALLPEHRLAA
jgi:hypothetical protein